MKSAQSAQSADYCQANSAVNKSYKPAGYASADGGDTWQAIVHDLPAVLSVEVQALP